MKINLSEIDKENFLVIPNHIGAKWTVDNLHLRSSLYNSDGELISASYKKFFNWEEHCEIVDKPSDISKVEMLDKIDGSTLIISKYKGNLIIRTRGTVDATKLGNGHEIEILKKKYPLVFDFSHLPDTHNFSYIFEWVSSENKIVLSYEDCPDIFLTACINHDYYSMASQESLDNLADYMGVKRPGRYKFDTMSDLLTTVEKMSGKEGICVYFNDGQDIKKVKSAEYLALHRFKSNATLSNTIDLYFEFGEVSREEFYKNLIDKFDFECFQMVKSFADYIYECMIEVNAILHELKSFAKGMEGWTRKDIAIRTNELYGPSGRSSFVFNYIDGREITVEKKKKLLLQVIENDGNSK